MEGSSPSRPSFALSLGLIALWALVALVTFALAWRGLAAAPVPPTPEQLQAAAVPRLLVGLREVLFLVALLYPIWAMAQTPPGGARARWPWAIFLLAVGVGLSVAEPLLIHLFASRGSLLWHQQFGLPLRLHGLPAEWVALVELGRAALAAALVLAAGLFGLGLAARLSARGAKALRGFLVAVAVFALGALALEWIIYAQALWRWTEILLAGLTLVLMLCSLPLWWGLGQPARRTASPR